MAKGCDKQRVPEPTLRMQWVMATWCLKITQRLPLPAGGGHNPDAIHCRCIRTSCHVHWFAMTRTCIFMTGTLGVLEILMLFCQGQWNHSSILIVYIHIYIYCTIFMYAYIYMYVCMYTYLFYIPFIQFPYCWYVQIDDDHARELVHLPPPIGAHGKAREPENGVQDITGVCEAVVRHVLVIPRDENCFTWRFPKMAVHPF